jgi:hypothetical protein
MSMRYIIQVHVMVFSVYMYSITEIKRFSRPRDSTHVGWQKQREREFRFSAIQHGCLRVITQNLHLKRTDGEDASLVSKLFKR